MLYCDVRCALFPYTYTDQKGDEEVEAQEGVPRNGDVVVYQQQGLITTVSIAPIEDSHQPENR